MKNRIQQNDVILLDGYEYIVTCVIAGHAYGILKANLRRIAGNEVYLGRIG